MRNRNIGINAGLIAIAMLSSAVAAPIPMSLTGLDKPVSVTSRALIIENGGSYNGSVGNPTLATPFSTTFWCVDIENGINVGDVNNRTYDANIILVGNTTAQSSFVQKGSVTAWEDGQNYTAQQRYNAAAYLVEKIQSGNSGYTDADLQHAIWRLTDVADNYDQSSGWENAAYLNAVQFGLNATTQHTWATVSGVAGANGALSNWNLRQTFLVEVAPVPEPGTYALMGGGLLILGILRRRRTK